MTRQLKKVLVVEDDLPLLQVIVRKLELSGYSPLEARTVDEANDMLLKNPETKAIWLDHYLIGDKNGIDFLTSLRTKESPWKTTPVIVVSNSITAEKVQLYKEIGANQYFVKAETTLQEIIDELGRQIQKF